MAGPCRYLSCQAYIDPGGGIDVDTVMSRELYIPHLFEVKLLEVF